MTARLRNVAVHRLVDHSKQSDAKLARKEIEEVKQCPCLPLEL